mmetsp:Transcript_10507/g.22651  ORF Transcript_10507/g.22651 Transcript_10507/m.22651 type:complete len:547 (-) Transcript_10507:482-2122(-)
MASKRRSSEIIKPLTAAGISGASSNGSSHRRSNSWCLSELEQYLSDDDTEDVDSLAEQLTHQRWHEIGNGPPPLCASSNFDVMVDQLSSILAMRLRELLVYWMGPAGGGMVASGGMDIKTMENSFSSLASVSSKNSTPMAMTMDYLRHDGNLGDYVLEDSMIQSIREYVTCIGKLYNKVGFHSFEHATHVTLSMNKLLSMVATNNNHFRDHVLKRGMSEKHCMSSYNRSSHHHHEGGRSFGIGHDPRISFAMIFSALIHDVGHTGVPNSVLVEEEDELAILHNDVSVAEQNSLQVAFSLLQRDEFATLKRCICPTPEERKFFRKKVISMVMVTDISDQERIQIVASRWNAAFPRESEEEQGGDNGAADNREANNSNGQQQGVDSKGKQRQSMPPRRRPSRTKSIQSPELRASLTRQRRFTMFTTDAAVAEFANVRDRRLGIRTSMDFSGMLIDAYRTVDQLQQHAVLETMMNAADVAHTMQSFAIFCKWNRRLYKEFYVAFLSERLAFNPEENWYENQIGFFYSLHNTAVKKDEDLWRVWYYRECV